MITVTVLILTQLSSEGTAFALRCCDDVEISVPSPVGDIKTVSSAVTLLPLRPASLTHRNPQRRKIIHGMRPEGRKDRSIDLNVCICRNIPIV